MPSYTDVFSETEIPPSGRSYRQISLVANITLSWPDNYEGDDFVADINDVAQSAENFRITLPDATGASIGRDFLVRNNGLYAFELDNNLGVPVATLQPGDAKYVYLQGNDSASGTWGVIAFGASTSGADASQLAGYGLGVLGSELVTNYEVLPFTADVSAASNHRAKILAFTSGSNTLTLMPVATAGDGWHCGVRNAGSGSITVATQGVDRIDDQASIVLVPGESLLVFCSGSTYYTVGYGRSTQFQFTKLVKDVTAGGTFTLTSAEAANKLLQFTGTPASNVTIIVPAVVSVYYVQNAYTGTATLTVKTSGGSGVALANNNDKAILFCDGTDVVSATTSSGGGGGGSSTAASDGSAAAPAFTFSADTNLGFYRITADTIGLAANGAEVARWGTTSSSVVGNFGIGTISPTTKLDVRGMGLFSGGGALAGNLPTGTMLQLGAADGSTTVGVIDAYGSSVVPMLALRRSRGTASAPTAVQSGDALGEVAFRGRGSTLWSGDRAAIVPVATQTWTDTAQGVAVKIAVTPNNSTTSDYKFVLDQNGWLMLGSSSNPSFPLHVKGDCWFEAGRVTSRYASFSSPDATTVVIERTDNGRAHVQLRNLTSDLGYWGAYDSGSGIVCMNVYNSAGTLEIFHVNDGTAGVAAYSYGTLSDESLKYNWQDLPEDFIDQLASLGKSGYYQLKQDESWHVGVGAQSLQRIMEHAVSRDHGGLLTVSYGNAALASCVELAKAIVQLREELRTLIQ